MNEADTRAQLIDPQLTNAGWGTISGSKILREVRLTAGRILGGGQRDKQQVADYVLEYKGQKLAVIEAKSDEQAVTEGVAQAKICGAMMQLAYAFAANGNAIYQMNLKTGREGHVGNFPSPDDLWAWVFTTANEWRDRFSQVPFEDVGGTKEVRYYQEIAVNRVMKAIADGKQRILLTLATGTGKTFIAFQIVWKLFSTRWNLQRDGGRRPRVLFLADRNILADQAFNAFSSLPADALVRIRPNQIRNRGAVPTNGSIFFTIFQTFMSGPNDVPYFGDYPSDFFDFIIIDECHRGGANDESTWRAILEYFSPAVQLGLTATPKRDDNVDTYRYFGDPVYIYSLKEGINDGFLTPFRVQRIQTTLDEYVYTSDDTIIEGQVEEGRIYQEADFNRIIQIQAREKKRVALYLSQVNPNDKTIVFCATQDHALAIRDLINQLNQSGNPFYCVRVTANDGEMGEQWLRKFQDNETFIPTVLTTSQKLSTGVDARNIRNIVLLRPINSLIEFKQIIGRGTRLFEGKSYFTIYDFVNAWHHFNDPEWDGEPQPPDSPELPAGEGRRNGVNDARDEGYDTQPDVHEPRMVKIWLNETRECQIQHMVATTFWGVDGRPLSAEEFLRRLFGALPDFFKDEGELRRIWANPDTRQALLDRLAGAGYSRDDLALCQHLIDAENSDLFDVLEYIAYAIQPIARRQRVAMAQPEIFKALSAREKEFVEYVLLQYIDNGVDELAVGKLPALLTLKYSTLTDAFSILGSVERIRELFITFQRHLYQAN